MAGDVRRQAAWSPALSPAGDRLAVISDSGGAPRVWVRPVHTGAGAGAGTGGILLATGDHPVVDVSWSPDGQWLACVIAPGGAPRTEIWIIRPDGTDLRHVAGFGSTTASMGRWLPGTGELALTESDTSSRAIAVSPSAQTRRVLSEGDLIMILDVSPDGEWLLLRRGPRGDRHLLALRPGAPEVIQLLSGVGSTDLGCFSADGSAVIARTDVGSELCSLVSVGLHAPDRPTVLARRLEAEVEHFAVTDARDRVAVLWNVDGGRSDLTLLEIGRAGRPARTAQQRSPKVPGAVIDTCVFSGDGSVLALAVEGPDLPKSVYCLDAATGTGLGEVPAPVTVADARPRLHRLRGDDGLEITGWLYLPAGNGPHPTMIHLHGGPEAQERPGYSALFQSLVACGIAVFAPNVRGSSGFGRTFVNADNGALRVGAISDVAACVRYLVDAAIAEPGQIGCMGRSYGGYLTLAALVAYPELFAVGMDVCGMSDLRTFYEYTEPWIASASVSKYGHPERDSELLRDLSPLGKMDRLAAPLLIVHGENDSNVPIHEAEQLVEALTALGRPHRYLMFPNEGHELLTRANRELFIEESVGWLSHHLTESPHLTETKVPALRY